MPKKRRFSIAGYRLHNGIAMLLGDLLAIATGFIVAAFIRTYLLSQNPLPFWFWYGYPLWVGGAILMRLVPSWGLGPVEELRRMTILQIFVHAVIAVVLIVVKTGFTDFITLGTVFFISSFFIPWTRLKVKRILINTGTWGVPVAIYGAGQTAIQVMTLLRHERGLGYNPVVVVENSERDSLPVDIDKKLVFSDSEINRDLIPVAIVAQESMSHDKLLGMLEGKLAGFFKVMVIPELFEVPSMWVKPRDIAGILGLEITSNLQSPFARFAKRAMDLVLVILCAPLWIPICVVTACVIWLSDRSNPIFLQERVGSNGRIFKTWKFRTMVPNAEEVLKKKLDQDENLRLQWLRHYKIKNDPRVTKIGRLLRRLSIDELPQLVNILKGEISLVGPRPLPLYHHKKLTTRVRELRERVRPGLTGLWQVSGRSDRPHEDMERLDSYYVRNWSPWLDMVVLVRTFRAVIKGDGAY